MIDDDGYVHVMSRSDDIINVAAHRFSTGKSIEYSVIRQQLTRMNRCNRTGDLVL